MIKIQPLSRKTYMKEKAFLNDAHNAYMMELGDKLYRQRQTLTSIVECEPKDYFQRVDGSISPTKRSKIGKFLAYYDDKFALDMDEQYLNIKRQMKNLSDEAKLAIHNSQQNL